jgi:misacylated tRNA(Ala) deacylase
LSASLCADLQTRVNEVVQADRSVRARLIDEGEFRQRPELRRTLDATPPVLDGQVRIVEIEGFDAQACGGTHVAGTADIGTLSIYKTENKGRINKRLYVRLGSPAREED